METPIFNINFRKMVGRDDELEVYQSLAREIINFLNQVGSALLWEIVRFTKGSTRRTLKLVNELTNKRMIKFESKNKLFYSLNYKKISITPKDVLCRTCRGRIVVPGKKFEKIRKDMKKIYQQKPTPTFLFDQKPVTLDTTLRRVAYMISERDLYEKKIVVLGDDDLTSIAISLTGLPKEITVFDVDERLINFIKAISKKYHIGVNAVLQDLTKKLPEKYINKFDVFLTDPTPTIKPLILFTNAGIRFLKKGRGHVGYISIFPSHMKKSIDFQRALTKMHLMITDLIPAFTEYPLIKGSYSKNDLELIKRYCGNETKISFSEYLMRVETTDLTQDLSKIEYSYREILGEATKKVLEDITKDPAFIRGSVKEKKYLREIAKRAQYQRKKGKRYTQ